MIPEDTGKRAVTRRGSSPLLWAGLLFLAALVAGCTGFQGVVYERAASGGIGAPIPGAVLRFINENGAAAQSVTSGSTGRYRISLGSGRYRVTVAHPGFEDYSSAPGFFVVAGSGYQIGNVFLHAPRATTVLLVRHAERVSDADQLTPAGVTRAAELVEVARNAGVAAVYVTATVRARETARPLFEYLQVPPTEYGTPQDVASAIATDHNGDVVLVVGHSNTLAAIAEAILGQNLYPTDPDVEDFDNLFVVTRPVGSSQGNVVNLQYGAPTAPDVSDMSRSQLTTFLLLRHAEGTGVTLSAQGVTRANALVEVARKANVTALFAPEGSLAAATLGPLATTLGQSVTSYDPGNTAALVSQALAAHAGETVVVAGDNDTLKRLIRDLGAQPIPVILDEFDHLMVVTVLAAGDARVVSLQYGAPSP